LFHLYSCANGRFHLVDCNMIFVFDYDYLRVNMNIKCITYQVRKQYPQIGFMNFLWKLICKVCNFIVVCRLWRNMLKIGLQLLHHSRVSNSILYI
jgi:hypothetical protein